MCTSLHAGHYNVGGFWIFKCSPVLCRVIVSIKSNRYGILLVKMLFQERCCIDFHCSCIFTVWFCRLARFSFEFYRNLFQKSRVDCDVLFCRMTSAIWCWNVLKMSARAFSWDTLRISSTKVHRRLQLRRNRHEEAWNNFAAGEHFHKLLDSFEIFQLSVTNFDGNGHLF